MRTDELSAHSTVGSSLMVRTYCYVAVVWLPYPLSRVLRLEPVED
jgi:hypothetical protein